MGDRSFIQIDSKHFQAPIVLYGHWSGRDNLYAVIEVLQRTSRIGDPSYLAAQLFYEFAITLGNYDGELSFGIDTGEVGTESWADNPTIYVNADTGEVKYNGEHYDGVDDITVINAIGHA